MRYQSPDAEPEPIRGSFTPGEGVSPAAPRLVDADQILREIEVRSPPPSPPPPHSMEAERAVLEAVLCRRKLPSELPCQASDFYAPYHAETFAACAALEDMGRKVDLVTVLGMMKREGAELEHAHEYLTELRDLTPARVYVDRAALVVASKALCRRVMAAMANVGGAWRNGLPARREDAAIIREYFG